MKLKSHCLELLFMSLSMLGSGKLSLGYALFRSVKSTHIRCHNSFPLDLDNHKNKNGVVTDLFCTGVIGYPGHMF